MKTPSRWVLLAACFAAIAALLIPAPALAVDRTFAGSAQLDYLLIPDRDSRNTQLTDTFGGFTVEAALKLSVDVSDHLSANVKICVACHGFETTWRIWIIASSMSSIFAQGASARASAPSICATTRPIIA